MILLRRKVPRNNCPDEADAWGDFPHVPPFNSQLITLKFLWLKLLAANVGKLREMTGAGLMDCKKALVEANGEIEAAMDYLRKKGIASAEKKASRVANEGVIAQHIQPGAKVGVIVEINCETDFVAKNESFRAFCDDIAKKLAADPAINLEADRVAVVAKIGENILISRHQRIEVTGNGLVAAYIHSGAKVGVLSKSAQASRKRPPRKNSSNSCATSPCRSRLGHPARGFARGSFARSHCERTRDRRVIRPPQRQARAGHGEDSPGCAGQVFPNLLPRGSGFRKAQSEVNVKEHVAQIGKQLGDEITIRRFVRFQDRDRRKRGVNFAPVNFKGVQQWTPFLFLRTSKVNRDLA